MKIKKWSCAGRPFGVGVGISVYEGVTHARIGSVMGGLIQIFYASAHFHLCKLGLRETLPETCEDARSACDLGSTR